MRATTRFLLFSTFIFLAYSCGTTSRMGSKDSRKAVKSGEEIETGVASWYGPNFHGKLTANGETFDMNQVSAAHRTLPFNTEVIVKNQDNGKSVRVRINDRGPYAKDRIIDLSRAAAEIIDMIGPGTANVKLYLVKGDLKNSRVTNLKVPNYTLQLGSYTDRPSAERRSKEIKGSRVEKLSLNGNDVFRVYYGNYTDTSKAERDLTRLKRRGINGFVKQIEND